MKTASWPASTDGGEGSAANRAAGPPAGTRGPSTWVVAGSTPSSHPPSGRRARSDAWQHGTQMAPAAAAGGPLGASGSRPVIRRPARSVPTNAVGVASHARPSGLMVRPSTRQVSPCRCRSRIATQPVSWLVRGWTRATAHPSATQTAPGVAATARSSSSPPWRSPERPGSRILATTGKPRGRAPGGAWAAVHEEGARSGTGPPDRRLPPWRRPATSSTARHTATTAASPSRKRERGILVRRVGR
jgi:hypothetical protein